MEVDSREHEMRRLEILDEFREGDNSTVMPCKEGSVTRPAIAEAMTRSKPLLYDAARFQVSCNTKHSPVRK